MDLPRHPRQGVEQWQNARNGLVVVRLHYTADPAKRSADWRAQAALHMHPRDWKREMEIDWAAPEGAPVIPEYVEATHTRAFEWSSDLRCLRGWDFGAVSPVVLFAQLTPWGQLRVRRELCPFNTPISQLWPMVGAMTVELGGPQVVLDVEGAYDVGGRAEVFDAGDPAGTNLTDLGSSAEYLAQHGVQLHTARPGTEISYSELRGRLLRSVMDPRLGPVPALIIHPECPVLRGALAGGFHLAPVPPYRPVKVHPEKDVVDALRYLNDNLSASGTSQAKAQRQMAQVDARELRAGSLEGTLREPVRWAP